MIKVQIIMRIFISQNPKVWTLFLSAVCCFLSTGSCAYIGADIAPKRCSLGLWFGPRCQFKCNCHESNPCDLSTGQCPLRCLPGWFGPSCQYRIANVGLPAWATDGDPNTCHMNTSQPIRAKLSPPMSLSWLQLGSKFSDDFNLITVKYVEKEGSKPKPKNCPSKALGGGKKHLYYTREIFCPVDNDVTEIIIENKGENPLCSIEVSLGRNLALKQPTFFNKPDPRDTSVKGDLGDTSILKASPVVSADRTSCLGNKDFPRDGKLFLDLNPDSPITSIQLHLHMTRDCCADIESYFRVSVFTDDYRELSLQASKRIKSLMSYLLVFVPPQSKSITLTTVEQIKESEDLLLCEIEAYGDCPKGTYGPQCEFKCNCQDNGRCSPTGLCPWMCPPGFKGSYCHQTCDAGQFGPDCRVRCSPFCTGGKCDPVNGTCLMGCELEFQPPDCKTTSTPDENLDMERLRTVDLSKENERLKRTMYVVSVSAGVLFLMLMSCTVYVMTPSPFSNEPMPDRYTPVEIDLDDPDFHFFLSYQDLKRYEMSDRRSWDSDVCVVDEDDIASNTVETNPVEIESITCNESIV